MRESADDRRLHVMTSSWNRGRTCYWCVYHFFPLFQSSQMAWPAHSIRQNFYDFYIANRSYEKHYRTLYERSNSTHMQQKLSAKVTKHFLAVHPYLTTVTALDIRDKPQFTLISFMSQLGGALNLWAGITVVVLIELIEFCYEVVVEWFNRKSPEKKPTPADQCGQELGILRGKGDQGPVSI